MGQHPKVLVSVVTLHGWCETSGLTPCERVIFSSKFNFTKILLLKLYFSFNLFCSCFNFGKLPQWFTLVMKSVLNCSCFCLELLNSFACHYCHPFCFILFIIQIWQGIQIIFFLSFFCVSQNIWFIEELSKKDKANLKEMVKKFTFHFTIYRD